jgi:ATP-binding cassette subfamily B protein
MHQEIAGQLDLGAVVALQTISMSMLLSLTSLVSTAQRLQSTRIHMERMRDILASQAEVRRATATPRLQGAIELDRVSFHYRGHAQPALRDVSLTIKPGAKVAIVGASGSGKSTLAMLLLGLYAPTTGTLCYDGIPSSALDPQAIRRQIGVVVQDSFVFADSIRDNIALTNPSLSQEHVERIAALAALDGDVSEMPMRYATRVGEGGSLVSGGQRQRIALARALANDPSILLLDEATSHLDALTERQITSQLDQLTCTRIIIAHRLSTVRTADEILVLDQGTLVERGTHEHLVAHGGRYAALVHGQGALSLQPG